MDQTVFLVLVCFCIWDHDQRLNKYAFDLILNNPEDPMDI
jgi:hypothetical protein